MTGGVTIAELVTFDGAPVPANTGRRLTYRGGSLLDTVGEVKGPTALSPEDFVTVVRVESDGTTSHIEFASGVLCTSCGTRVHLAGADGQPGHPMLTSSTPHDRRAWCGECATNWKAAQA